LQDHIERYCTLITYSSYVAVTAASRAPRTYRNFVAGYPEVRSAVARLVRAFPLLSLELDEDNADDESPEIAVRSICLLSPRALPAEHSVTSWTRA
jgi:hypothetical protein